MTLREQMRESADKLEQQANEIRDKISESTKEQFQEAAKQALCSPRWEAAKALRIAADKVDAIPLLGL